MIEFAQASSGQDAAVAEVFGAGAAGVVAPPVPAPPSRDWLGIRMLRPAETMPFASLDCAGPPLPGSCPLVSVVVCARRGERAVAQCFRSLSRLAYPNFEVMIVADRDRPGVSDALAQFPHFQLIRQSNQGLGAARNAGVKAARGEIVAFVEPNFAVDPDWLTFMVRAMQDGQFDACCGPAYVPRETAKLAACMAAAPLSLSSNIFGAAMARSNLAFTKDVLRPRGWIRAQVQVVRRRYGPVPQDRRDQCEARLQPGRAGVELAPNTLRTFLSQQGSYGRVDADLGRWGADRSGTPVGRAGVIGQTGRTLLALPQSVEWMVLWTIGAVLARFVGLSAFAALPCWRSGPRGRLSQRGPRHWINH